MPNSGKVKIKVICSHTLLLQLLSAAECVSCSKQEHITTLRTCVWYWLHSSSGIDGVYSWNSCDTPSNSKVKTKRHLFSYLVISGSECCPMCQLIQTGTNYHITYMCLVLVAPIFWHYIEWWFFINETHVMPSSGKVKTKRHLFSYLVLAGSECCPMCQLLQTGTNYHITYIWMVPVAPILWHYIDWWCLFMKHMWCHLVAK